jgi:hypothetical protein
MRWLRGEKPPYNEQMVTNPIEASGSRCWIAAKRLVESGRWPVANKRTISHVVATLE